jgi:aldehyde dehydrogenase (NAD+)
MRTLRVGQGLAEDTVIGAFLSAEQLDQVLVYLALGREEGAELAHVFDRVVRDTDGFFLEPALFVST